MIDVILIIGISLFVGYQIGVSITAYRLRHLIFKAAKEKGYDVEKYLEPKVETTLIYQLEVEQVNDVLYLYNRTQNEFICQGSSIDELAELSKKYKNIKYAAVLYGKNVYSFVDGKSTEKL